MSPEPVPIACTLTPSAAVDQALEWADLRQHTASADAVPGGARMVFPAALETRVADLVRRESACCAFLEITTTVDGDQLIVAVTSTNPDALPVISHLAGLAPS